MEVNYPKSPWLESDPVGQAETAISVQLAVAKADRVGFGGTVYNKIVQVLLYVAAVVLPLFYLPLTSSLLEYNKQMLLLVLAAVGLVVWLLGVVVSGKLTVRTSPLDKGVLGLLLAFGLATIFSLAPARSLFGLPISLSSSFISLAALSVLYFLAVNTLHDRGRMLRSALSLSVVLALALGLLQIFHWYILPGAFTHAQRFNTLGSLSALGVLAAIVLPLFSKTLGKNASGIIALLGVILSVLTLGMLNSWALWLVALAGMLAMIAFDSLNVTQLAQDYGAQKGNFSLARFVVPMIVIVIGGFLLLVNFNPASVKSSLAAEISPTYRLSLGVAKRVIAQKPALGYGPENFSFAFDRFGASTLANSQFSTVRFLNARSEVVNMVVHGGLVALLALALLLWSLVQVIARFGGAISESVARGDGASFASESSGTLAAVVAACVALFLYPFSLTLLLVLYVLLALAALVIVGERSTTVDIEARPMYSLSASLGFIVGLVLVLTGLYFSSKMFLADVTYGHALAQTKPDGAIEGLVKAIGLNGRSDKYLRESSQLTLAIMRDEIAKQGQDKNQIEDRRQRIQNLISSSIQLAQQATQVQPLESSNWNNLGLVYQSLTGLVDNVEQLAEAAYNKASELRPGDPEFDNSIGQMWLNRAELIQEVGRTAKGANIQALQKQYEESLGRAEVSFKKAIAKADTFGLAIYNLGAVYDRQDKVDEAIKQIEKITPYNANQPTLMFQLGLLYIRAERKDDAVAAMQRAVLLAPQYANARWYLALLLEERKDLDGALVQLNEIKIKNPDNDILNQKIAELEAGKVSIPPGQVIDTEPLQ